MLPSVLATFKYQPAGIIIPPSCHHTVSSWYFIKFGDVGARSPKTLATLHKEGCPTDRAVNIPVVVLAAGVKYRVLYVLGPAGISGHKSILYRLLKKKLRALSGVTLFEIIVSTSDLE
jgi:hypothetical protein